MKKILFVLCIIIFLSACGSPDITSTPAIIPTTPTIIIPAPRPTEPNCTTVNLSPTPGPETPSIFPPVGSTDHIRGKQDAAITILLYNDFQCTDCNYLPMSKHLLENHPDEVRIVYRYYPYVTYFDKGELAAQAAEAAAAQGKFWEMHDLLFEQQPEWIELSSTSFGNWISAKAGELGLDTSQFEKDLQSVETVEKVKKAVDEGERIGIPQLPFYLVNGQIYRGPTSFEALDQVINLISLGERQFSECPPMSIETNKQYVATLETEKGNIVIRLFADKAPMAVNSFVFLARQGWYDGITFHRVLPGFVAQTGDPSGTGQGNPGYMFDNEYDPTLTFNQAGLIGLANSGPDTNGSQFFITFAAAPSLNGGYTIFGQVVSGMDVVERLTPRNPQPGISQPPGDTLIRVTIEEN